MAWAKTQGKIPPYLQRFRQEEAAEAERTRYEIMMNKGKTDTTRRITKQEQDRVLEDLHARKEFLNEGIKNMSVTLYTTRAQN